MDGDERDQGHVSGKFLQAVDSVRRQANQAMSFPGTALAQLVEQPELTTRSGCLQSWKSKRGGQGARGEGILQDNVSTSA